MVERRGVNPERVLLNKLRTEADRRLKAFQEEQAQAWVKIKARRDAKRLKPCVRCGDLPTPERTGVCGYYHTSNSCPHRSSAQEVA